MKLRISRHLTLSVFLLGSLLLAGCGGQPAPSENMQVGITPQVAATRAPTDTSEPTLPPASESEVVPDPGAPYLPIGEDDCRELAEAARQTLNLPEEAVTSGLAPFVDMLHAAEGTGCQVSIRSTGAEVGGFIEAANSLKGMLEERGWFEDPQYAADGPTGTAFAMREADRLALVEVGWQPAPEANCPPDRPIIECSVAPEQQIFDIRLNIARLNSGG